MEEEKGKEEGGAEGERKGKRLCIHSLGFFAFKRGFRQSHTFSTMYRTFGLQEIDLCLYQKCISFDNIFKYLKSCIVFKELYQIILF